MRYRHPEQATGQETRHNITNFQIGDYIHHRQNNTLWHVLAINPDGTLQVEFYAGSRHTNWRLKTIKRPEEYRKVKDDYKGVLK